MSSRSRAPILKWCWHLGQTFRFASRSALKMTARQPTHLIHKPSVRTVLPAASAPPLGPAPDSYSPSSRLNQDIQTLSVLTAVSPHFSQAAQNRSAGLLAGCPEGLPALRAFARPSVVCSR